MRITTPLRTALDLGRLRHRDRALAALDQLLRLGRFSREELLDGIERFKGFRGVRQLRVLAPFADGRSESPGESVLRLRFSQASAPRPTPQVEIRAPDGGFIGRADLAIEDLRHVAEYDGERWHGPDRAVHDVRRRARFEQAGWTVSVFRAADLRSKQLDRTIERIWDDVRAARRRLGMPGGEPDRCA